MTTQDGSGDIELVPDPDDPITGTRGTATTASLDNWLAILIERKGSDLLLVPGAPVCILLDGRVKNIGVRLSRDGKSKLRLFPPYPRMQPSRIVIRESQISPTT